MRAVDAGVLTDGFGNVLLAERETAKTIIREMETTSGIAANRLAGKEPEPATDGAEPAAKLSLDTLRGIVP